MEEKDILYGTYENKELAEQAAARFNSTIDTTYKSFIVVEEDGKFYLVLRYKEYVVSANKTNKTLIICILVGISIYLILKNKTK